MKTKKFILVSLVAIALTGCSSGQSPVPENSPSPSASQEGDLGQINTDLKAVNIDVPEVDKGLRISLPTASIYEVSLNEKITINAGGLPPDTDADIYLMYNLSGRDAVLNIKSVKVKEDGSIKENVNVPKNLYPGTFVLAVESSDDVLYPVTLEIKE